MNKLIVPALVSVAFGFIYYMTITEFVLKSSQLKSAPLTKFINSKSRVGPYPDEPGVEKVIHLIKLGLPNGTRFVSYEEVEANVFDKFGYKIIEQTLPVPRLGFKNEPTCDQVFSEWLEVGKTAINKDAAPPKTMPLELRERYLMYGYASEVSWYFDDRSIPTPRTWDQITRYMEYPMETLLQRVNYGDNGKCVYHALNFFKSSIAGKYGVVIGSVTPWAEVLALRAGEASKVLTVEWQKTTIVGTDRIGYIHPVEFANRSAEFVEKFDFAITYSSLEHSGLGRYGDPLDPIGDLREVLKIKCSLKKGGLLFLGFPNGMDSVIFNAHRFYGRIRLAMVMAGFEWVGSFRANNKEPIDLRLEHFENQQPGIDYQDLFVLKKL